MDYLARCSYLLNQGLPAVDVAVFTGEEAPLTALYGDRPDDSVPAGFGFDYVGLDGLENCVTVEDGTLVARGARYRALYLGGSSQRMTLRALRRIRALLDEGATVIGTAAGLLAVARRRSTPSTRASSVSCGRRASTAAG